MCKKKIDNNSNHITISRDNYNKGYVYKGYVYFHRFCYFNYRTEFVK